MTRAQEIAALPPEERAKRYQGLVTTIRAIEDEIGAPEPGESKCLLYAARKLQDAASNALRRSKLEEACCDDAVTFGSCECG